MRRWRRARGCPAVILHGTATLALAIGVVVDEALAGDPERVERIAARFTRDDPAALADDGADSFRTNATAASASTC
jgi:acyl dehydratase